MNLEEKVKKLIEKKVNDLGFIIDNVEYIKEGSSYFLRITIDKTGFITIDDCVAASKVINPLLDEIENEFDECYILDVSSKEKGN
ncbi:MAG: ribosome maturation factor RimP [Mycoplasmatota bacterium]